MLKIVPTIMPPTLLKHLCFVKLKRSYYAERCASKTDATLQIRLRTTAKKVSYSTNVQVGYPRGRGRCSERVNQRKVSPPKIDRLCNPSSVRRFMECGERLHVFSVTPRLEGNPIIHGFTGH